MPVDDALGGWCVAGHLRSIVHLSRQHLILELLLVGHKRFF